LQGTQGAFLGKCCIVILDQVCNLAQIKCDVLLQEALMSTKEQTEDLMIVRHHLYTFSQSAYQGLENNHKYNTQQD